MFLKISRVDMYYNMVTWIHESLKAYLCLTIIDKVLMYNYYKHTRVFMEEFPLKRFIKYIYLTDNTVEFRLCQWGFYWLRDI